MILHLTSADWLALFGHFAMLSLLAVGGALATAPDMHRYLVEDKLWLTDPQFTSSIALAQAAPGPNVLFVALLGWNVGLNAGGGIGAGSSAWGHALLGVGIAMVGILLPSTTLTFLASRWGHRNRAHPAVRAFKQGLAPLVVGLLLSTAWILAGSHGSMTQSWRPWVLSFFAMLIVWRTRLHLLWLLAAGGLMGWAGVV